MVEFSILIISMELNQVVHRKESRERDVVGQMMTEDPYIKQRNLFARLVTLNEELFIVPLNSEFAPLESLSRS